MTRKRVVLAAAIIAIVGLAAAGTNAYITADAHTTNVITTAKIDIDLKESMMVDGKKVDWPGDGIQGVMPGQSVSKIVEVENKDDSGPAWIRVSVKSEIQKDGEDSPQPAENGMLIFDIQRGWIDGGDGYYYYSKPVGTGETTPALFNNVEFSGSMGNEYQNCTAYVHVFAQATQVKNNDNNGALTELNESNFSQVKGWPAADAPAAEAGA